MEIKVLIEAPQLADAINNLASSLSGVRNDKVVAKNLVKEDKAEKVEKANDKVEENEKFAMFQDLKVAATALKNADEEVYMTCLYKFVPEGKKYSAVEPADWGAATKLFKEALADLGTKEEETEEEDYSEEAEAETEAPRLDISGIRKLSAKAKNSGVSVGKIMKTVTGVTKVSDIPEDKYNAYEDALNEAMEEAEA